MSTTGSTSETSSGSATFAVSSVGVLSGSVTGSDTCGRGAANEEGEGEGATRRDEEGDGARSDAGEDTL